LARAANSLPAEPTAQPPRGPWSVEQTRLRLGPWPAAGWSGTDETLLPARLSWALVAAVWQARPAGQAAAEVPLGWRELAAQPVLQQAENDLAQHLRESLSAVV
jgi:hypothetical protein